MEKISSRRNPLCVHFKKLGTRREYRESCGEFLCDGLKLLSDADKCGAEIVAVLTSGHLPFPLPVETKVFLTDNSIINSLSPLKNAQNVLFSCKMPRQGAGVFTGTQILLDGVQDPGNVGTIIRTADALGIGNVILTAGCADLYNPKTIRATMGAIFRQPVSRLNFAELLSLKNSGVHFVGASAGEDCEDISEVSLTGSVIAIGSEGGGLSGQVLSLCGRRVKIPVSPECESLNAAVAAAIFMWSAK